MLALYSVSANAGYITHQDNVISNQLSPKAILNRHAILPGLIENIIVIGKPSDSIDIFVNNQNRLTILL